MAQGKFKAKNASGLKRKAKSGAIGVRGKKSGKHQRPNAPSKQRRRLRGDKKVTGLLHNNIETLMAAKALRNESGSLRMKDLRGKGKDQLKVEEKSQTKKTRTKSDAQEAQLKNAIKKLNKSG